MAEETTKENTATTTTDASTENKEAADQNVTTETSDDLATMRNEVIKTYFDKRDKEKWFIVFSDLNISTNLLRGMQKKRLLKSLEEAETAAKTTVTGENIDAEQVTKNINTALNQKTTEILNKTPMGNFMYDDTKILALKEKLMDKDKLTALKTEIEKDGADINAILLGTAATTTVVAATTTATESTTKETAKTSVEELTDRRKAVVANMNAVLEQDRIKEKQGEKQGVDYHRWWSKSIEEWLDCWWLIVYCANQAGLQVGGNSRELFEKFPSKKLEVDEKGAITTDVSEFEEWDIIVRDALDPAFYGTKENEGRQHGVTGTEGQVIHPHHFGFIGKDGINKKKGIVNTVESNGTYGVTDETPCDVSHWLDASKVGTRKSAIRAVHVNYDKLDKLSADALNKLEDLPDAKRATA